jgi:prevent-host-death family protein
MVLTEVRMEVGVRELKTRASEIIREVRDKRARYVISYRGRPVAVLAPLDAVAECPDDGKAAWEELKRIGREISQHWESDQSPTELLSQMRR